MKSLNEFKSIVEEEKSDYSKLDILVRAGLANKAQLQRIHKIMDKMGEERPMFNNADREIMRNLFNRMADLITSNKQIYTRARQAVREELEEAKSDSAGSAYPLVPDPPVVMVIKRKSVRLFPDGTRVALYYSDKLKRYFSVPYGPAIDNPVQAEEYIQESDEIQLNDGSLIPLDEEIKKNIVNALKKLRKENKERFVEFMLTSVENFERSYEFCKQHHTK